MNKKDTHTFKPAFGLKNKHAQTLYSSFFRKIDPIPMDIEKFEFEDGDFVDCYWHNKPDKNTSIPIVTLFHGLTGSYKSPYIQGLMNSLAQNGFATVLMHFRGCSGRMNRLARSYHSGDTGDALKWIQHLKQNFKNSPLFAVGFSLGGNMLLKLLGEMRNNSPLQAAVSVSAPIQLDICANKMNSGFSLLYQKHLMKNLKKSLQEKYKLHDMKSLIGIEEGVVTKLRSFWEFDEVYTAPIHGFDSASDYYKKSSSKQYLKEITTNTLLIHSLDDPFMTPEVLPKDDDISSKVKLEIYPHGGHVAFISGTFLNPEYWLEKRIVNYFKT